MGVLPPAVFLTAFIYDASMILPGPYGKADTSGERA
jgi:hypothetical protein